MRLRERPRHYRCTPLQKKLWEDTCAVPGPRRCPHLPHRRHPGQRGVMACQPRPRQRTWLQMASRQLQGQGGRERKMLKLEPIHTQHTIHHLHNTSTLLLLCQMQHRYIGHTASHTASSCGEQVPDVAIPHYEDARMQHSQSRPLALLGVTTAVAPKAVPASTNEVFPASPT